ncbi:MAG: hypothetical protein M0Z68_07415 [Gammaproteobacteria bacterium]|nr:hypothetical protein [Gammaproteobacteria bacterium]
MCHTLLQDPSFFRFLCHIDAELAAEVREGRCPRCAGPLHVADFPRKPRGCPAAVREEYSRRLSFTCGRCETRTTPASVRFLGRRVYVAVMLMLTAPPTGPAAHTLAERLGVPARTLQRWRAWWRKDFQQTRFWQSVRARFMPPLPATGLPVSLFERFQGSDCPERMVQLLRFVAPLSETPMSQ